MRTKLALLLVTLPITASATEKIPSYKPGTRYSEVRSGLLKSGFRPYFYPDTNDRCLGRDAICNSFPETRICRGTGRAGCEFILVRGKSTLFVVETTGEHPSDPAFERIRRASKGETKDLLELAE